MFKISQTGKKSCFLVPQLQSPNEENRESACTSIANFVSDKGTVRGLLQLNVVKILGPLVLDPSWNIRLRALGALRYLQASQFTFVSLQMNTLKRIKV